ncbi:potassium channel family protein [Algoriphagus sp. SE2]|uniref:potassium channel family protein n=1 Tax=Algoriphagus sp. SE2 TaxID=3141536 RepID=UPI0031CD823C
MKKSFNYLTLAVLLLLTCFSAFAQDEIEFKEYSYSEFFQLIEDEKDSLFILKNARIEFDSLTDMAHAYITKAKGQDGDSINYKFWREENIHIEKAIELENVFFGSFGSYGLHHLIFEKKVSFLNTEFNILFCEFKEKPRFLYNEDFEKVQLSINGRNYTGLIRILSSNFHNSFALTDLSSNESPTNLSVIIGFNKIHLKPTRVIGNTNYLSFMWLSKNTYSRFFNNTFLNSGEVKISPNKGTDFYLEKNNFGDASVEITVNAGNVIPNLVIEENNFNKPVGLKIGEITTTNKIGWNQFQKGFYDSFTYLNYYTPRFFSTHDGQALNDLILSDSIQTQYLENVRVSESNIYKREVQLLGRLNALYKSQHDPEFANSSYIALKDLETKRLAYLYKTNPSFTPFFKWKVNQFLKVFSDYGTEPAKAITFSTYVILVFALVYLFFPNHWDSHGKNRIMDRYRFFAKYMKKDSGIHEVYLDEKREEMMAAEDFRAYMLKSKQEIPGFFMATALPLYRWSVAGTKSFSWLLSKVDVLKGTWSSTEDSKKAGKSVLIIGAFVIALLYDLFIKMLNALMLSINTFTTLGFGEIPIKGLPRYLAIIQGFIGWFMLTIFSVSLISQLLN